MWTRKQLKEKGKTSFKANYWRAVLVAFVLVLITGGIAGLSSSGSVATAPMAGGGYIANTGTDNGTINIDGITSENGTLSPEQREELEDKLDGLGIDSDEIAGGSFSLGSDGLDLKNDDGSSVRIDEGGIHVETSDGDSVDIANNATGPDGVASAAVLAAVGIGVMLVMLIALAIALVIDAFLLNPIEIGARRFFLTNLNRKAEIKELAFGFDHNYLNNVKTMFLRDLFTILWSLLFIIPGIVKSYEYRMIPYLIAENPEIDYKTAFAQSKQMMYGQKWKTFVLDLSFIGWWLLTVLTLGILGVFYVGPYIAATSAALYEALRYGNGQTDQPTSSFTNDPFAAPTAGQPFAAQAAQPHAAPDMSDQPAWATEQPVAPNAASTEPPAAGTATEQAGPAGTTPADDPVKPVPPQL